jgi:adenylyl-sulfate kinase
MSAGFVVWFTGLSGAGKSTLAAMLSAALRSRGVHVEVLDGDEVRTHLSKGLGFSREDRDTNVRRIGYVAKLCARSGACAMTAAISPYRAVRDEQRAQIDRFVEVYCRCEIPVLAERDPKGLYKKALAGEIKNFTGIDDPYEPPLAPEVTVDTSAETKEESLARILTKLEALGYVSPGVAPAAVAARTAGGPTALIAPHGGELVDRFAKGDDLTALTARAASLPVIALDERAARDLDAIATGALSPLKGFMNSKDFLRVVREMRLENGLPWPLPVTLSVSAVEAAAIEVGASVALVQGEGGRRLAVLEVSDIFRPAAALASLGDAPGLDEETRALAPDGAVFVGGEVRVLERSDPSPSAKEDDPQALRARFTERGQARVVGFHAEGIFSRADEHLARAALESADALLVQVPIEGAAKEGYPVEVRRRCCDAVLERYYAEGRAVVALCPASRSAGSPRAAVLRAILQKNYGCSHVVIPLGEVRSPEALRVRRAFAAFSPGEIGVEPLFFDEVRISTTLAGPCTARTAPREPSREILPFGAQIEAWLTRGEPMPSELVRPEVIEILRAERRRPGEASSERST